VSEHPAYPAAVRDCIVAACERLRAVSESLRAIGTLATPESMESAADAAAERIEEVVRRLGR